MKITTLGVITTLKNLGMFLASYKISGIKTDWQSFAYAFIIYACVSVPSDLLLLNHASNNKKEELDDG